MASPVSFFNASSTSSPSLVGWRSLSHPESSGDAELAFPPDPARVPGVWQWQSEAGWHCFSRSQCEALEAGWAAGQAVVHLRVGPWSYRIDMNNMLQQNTATRRMRHIRRSSQSAALWFRENADGTATRYDPQVEASLEAKHCDWTEQTTGSADGALSQSVSSTTTWESSDGCSYVADVERMTETCMATGAVRKICRCVLRPSDRPNEVPVPNRPGTTFPSLTVGIGESGTCKCAGNLRVVDPKDLADVLLPVEKEEVVDDVCAICLDPLEVPQLPKTSASAAVGTSGYLEESKEVVKLKKCSHMYHRGCVVVYVSRAGRGGFACPTCSTVQCTGNGPSPAGTMKWQIDQTPSLGGYSDSGTIYVEYDLPSGIQSARHARPGSPFAGTRRSAYLPDTIEGREILSLLIHAFVKGHTFTVGTSLTTGRSDVVVWNGIHHKTNRSGGPTGYGYPDASYFDRVFTELEAKGVTRELLSTSSANATPQSSSSRKGGPEENGKNESKADTTSALIYNGCREVPRSAAGQVPADSDIGDLSRKSRGRDSAEGSGESFSSTYARHRNGGAAPGRTSRRGRRAMRGVSCCGLSTAVSVRTPPLRRGLEPARRVTCCSVDETPGNSFPVSQAPAEPRVQSSEESGSRAVTCSSRNSRSRRESHEHVRSHAGDVERGGAGFHEEARFLSKREERTVGTGDALTHGELDEEDRGFKGLESNGLAELTATEADKALKRCRSNDILYARGENFRTHRGYVESREASRKTE
ncbi:WWE domain-containing protein [Toxoplasma gondii TgCatPRC2]|uniref:RING-type E3 ubiquitin transferase n=1 Tax=Toxoplasma gondii TgCatPRC2 TaxID=1130821 RepID=A0A151HFE8_TOXGO|nr:WWE domain-containing protein [Toxoplasma gondii TgCatPRC2]